MKVPFFSAESFYNLSKARGYPEYAKMADRANELIQPLIEENARLKEELAQAIRAWPQLVKSGIAIGKIP